MGYSENDSFENIVIEGTNYVVTPWSQVHQDILFDGMFAPEKIFNQLYSISSRLDHTLTKPIEPLSALPAILFFHNRRKTEKFLHNSRYLIVNPLGFSANLTGIMGSFCDTNFTYLDAWLRSRVENQYLSFGRKMLKLRDLGVKKIENCLEDVELHDLWLDTPLVHPDMLTLFIYSTYMMTKAPVNSSIEQATNLWEILQDVKDFSDIHKEVNGLDDHSLRFNVLDFNERVYDDDFKYDPVFSQYLGYYMSSYLKPSLGMGELSNKWEEIYNSDIDRSANSNGLRGYKKSNFFNRKGYDVLYEKIDDLLSDSEINERIESYLEMEHSTAAQAIKSDRISYKNFSKNYEKLVFHIVHKIQRGGSREIFCMDLNTKVIQSPVESFFTFICKKVPNEFISIPSGKRHSQIHSDFYEKKISPWVKNVVRWVLDCRRWAPHSVFQKYIHFIIGMSDILPSSFLEHFYKMSEGMMKKQFVTREHVLSKMRNNKKFEPYAHLLTPMSNVANAVSMTVQFSFVMGIFNYLSTLMHAANQLVASEVIRNQCLSRNLGLVVMDPKCHSDDSVVSSYHESKESIKLSALLYDWLLKGANHMLSVKKSQLNNDVYLEFLSTLYVLDRFLPVFPKFVSTIPFKPTDQGLMSDLSFSVSQSLELLTMGGSFEECYLLMKTTDHAIRKIYNLPSIPELPPQFFGSFDAHPLELLYAGSNTDIYNFYQYRNKDFWNIYMFLANEGFVDMDRNTLTVEWDMGAFLDNKIKRKIKNLKPLIEKLEGARWTLSNCKMGNSTLNLIWYSLKMNDRKFRSSLVDEPVARRVSRIFGAGSYRRIRKTDNSLVEVTKLHAALQKYKLLVSDSTNNQTEVFLDYMSQDLSELHRALLSTRIVSNEQSNIKDKPVTVSIGTARIGSGTLSASEFVSYVKEPLGHKMLARFKNPYREVTRIVEELQIFGIDVNEISPDLLYVMARKLMGNDLHTYRIIASVPSGVRYLSNFTHTITLLEAVTYSHRKLKVKNTNAASVDWEKKLIAGKMPNSAREYIKMFWVCQILADAKILDMDVYLESPREKELELSRNLPDEWKMILLTSVSQSDSPLVELNHWVYWEKEQIKLGRTWVGGGICVVKLPEATFRITMAGGNCTGIEVFSRHSGMFTQSSSWFLHNVLRYGAVSAQLYDPLLAAPNELYLGVISNSVVYGLGRSRNFDMILDVTWLDAEPVPSEFHNKMMFKKSGSHYNYIGQVKNYYIDFFIPVEDPVKVSFKGIFDFEKVKEKSSDHNLNQFIKNLSIDLGAYMEIEFDFMLDNLGSSTLYHMMFNSSKRAALLNNDCVYDYLATSFSEWKKTHPDFGYPNEEQMVTLHKDPESPPFPRLIMNSLLRLGKTNMSDTEFQSVLVQLSKMNEDERFIFLSSNYGFLDSSMRSNAISLISRSKIIFSSCTIIGKNSLNVLIPFLLSVSDCLKEYNIKSSTMAAKQRMLFFSKKIRVTDQDFFKTLSCKLVYDGLFSESPSVKESYRLLQTIISELWDDNLGDYLNIFCTDPLTRTIDFSVQKNILLDWLDDLVYNHFKCNYKSKMLSSVRSLFDMLPEFQKILSPIKKILTSFSAISIPKSIKLVFKKSSMTLKLSSPLWGLTMSEDFFPLGEENQEELKYALETDDQETIEDLMAEEDPDAEEIPNFSFTYAQKGDFKSLTSARGTGWNVFVWCPSIHPDIRLIKSKISIYKRKLGFNNLPSFFENGETYIVYMGVQNTNAKIPGYNELNFEQINVELKPKVNYKRFLDNDGTLVVRETFLKDAQMQNKLLTFDNYFKKIDKTLVFEDVKKVHKISETYELDKGNKKLKDAVLKLERMLTEVEQNDKDGEEANKIDFSMISKLFKEYMEELSRSKQGPETVKEFFRANFSNFNFAEPLSVLSDIVARSEINVLFPGSLDAILNGDIKLSKKTKERIVRYAGLEIKEMPKMLRKKYNKLLFLVKAVLNDIPECKYLQSESLDFAAKIDEMFNKGNDMSDSDSPMEDLLPELLTDKISFDLSKILQ
jgi:hypothetical protein